MILETGVRPGEAVNLQWKDVYLQRAVRAKFGYIAIRSGKSRNAKRNLSLTVRAAEMLKNRKALVKSAWVFPGDSEAASILGTSIDHQHDDVHDTLKLSKEFVVHSLRHTMLTRLGEAGADAFTIMRIAGHSSVTASQRYVHPTPEGMERAFKRFQELNATKAEVVAAGAEGLGLAAKIPTVKTKALRKSSQVIAIKKRALSSAVRAADS